VAGKQRLDVLLVQKGLAGSRERARSLIMAGKVRVNDRPMDKAGAMVSDADAILLKGDDIPYASRGGLKLAAALETFAIEVAGRTCLDVGASTGGFTDCLLQKGAARVYAVDVGYGQLAWKLRQDPKVTVIERTNIRRMAADAIPEAVDLVVIDVSFISLKIAAPAAVAFARPGADMVALIKPQFEVGKGRVGKGGVVKDPDQRAAVIDDLKSFFMGAGLRPRDVIPSPILGPKGNQEFLIHLKI
jgi:23S rRNA (cytidine1920-2'-O)/16S rRNA (cytidine1409-2'-O)-methyltransferase